MFSTIVSDLSLLCTCVTLQRQLVLQFSISCVYLQEYSKTYLKEIVAGGKHHDPTIETRFERSEEVHESFPTFEEKSIRNDPIDVRNTYPVQALGLKTTVDFQDEVR